LSLALLFNQPGGGPPPTETVTVYGTYPVYRLVGQNTAWSGQPFSLVGSSTAEITEQVIVSTTEAFLYLEGNGDDGPFVASDGVIDDISLPAAGTSGTAPRVYVVAYEGPTIVSPGSTGPILFYITAQDGLTIPQPTGARLSIQLPDMSTASLNLDTSSIGASVQQVVATNGYTFAARGSYLIELTLSYANGDIATGTMLVLCNS